MTFSYFVSEIVFLAIADLLIYVPLLFRLTFRNFKFVHDEITSDIPGNPHVFNLLIISLFQTLPEPNNFNLVWTRVPLDEDIIVRGKIPISRMSSWSVYGEGSDGVPNTIELHCNVDPIHRDFEVILTKNPKAYEDKSKNILVVDTKEWKYGMCVMRNYLVPPGTEVYTPELITVSSKDKHNPTIIRQSQQLVAGAATLHMDVSQYIKRIKQLLIANSLIWLCNTFYGLITDNIIYNNLIITFSGLGLFVIIYNLLYFIAKRNLHKFVKMFCNERNQLYLTSLKESSKASQPSKLHRYWIMNYSIKEGEELRITGNILPSNQKYWSMVIYDKYGLPLPQFAYDENIHRIYKDSKEESSSEDRVYSYDLRMKNYGKGGNKRPQNSSERKGSDSTIFDVSNAPKGYVLFRLVHPTHDAAAEYSHPKTELLTSSKNRNSKKEN